MVEGLLKFETSDFACGSHHMMAITTENTVYTWGKGDSGEWRNSYLIAILSPTRGKCLD